MLRFLVIVFLFLTSACHAQSSDVVVHRAISYCKGGQKDLLLDVVEPTDRSAKRPAILFVHGGGWMAGGREDYFPLMMSVASKGYVTASIDYRLSQEAIFPAQVEDVKCAVRWLRAHADEYGVDPAHIGAVGGSAGAHLVAMAAATENTREYEGAGGYADQPSNLQAMVLHGGIYDLRPAVVSATIREDTRGVAYMLIGRASWHDSKAFEAASPFMRVTKDSPPVLLLHGREDDIVSVTQSVMMEQKMKKAGTDARLVIIPEAGHMDFGKNPDEIGRIFFDFLDKNLKAQK